MIKKIVELNTKEGSDGKKLGGRKIADKLGVSRYKVEKVIKLLNETNAEYVLSLSWDKIFPNEKKKKSGKAFKKEALENKLNNDRLLKKQKVEIKHLRKKYDQALQEIESLGKTADLVQYLSQNKTKFNSSDVRLRRKKGKKNRAVAFMIASDWHVEEEVDPATINGFNAYNMDVAAERSRNFFINGVTLINQFSNFFYQVDTLVLALLGDLISGYIHEELMESNKCSPTEAILFVTDLINWGIEYILANTKMSEVVVPCCFGNHGRTTPRRKVSTSYKNSFEWLMYKSLQKQYENHPKVHFIVENGYHVYLNVFDKFMIRFHHGDNIRYWGGVGGLSVPVNKSISQWNKIKPAYLDVFGHFHQLKDDGSWVSNGSLIGYNAFALSIKAGYEPPRQAFFMIDEKRGKTINCPIYVEDDIII